MKEKNILLIDYDKNQQLLLEAILKDYHLHIADHARQALPICQSTEIHLAIIEPYVKERYWFDYQNQSSVYSCNSTKYL